MTRLSDREFQAMNSVPRRLLQRLYEFPRLRHMGVTFRGKDVLEIGCGSGYAAWLIARDAPRSYLGVDVMPEQLKLARLRPIPQAEFRLEDATALTSVASSSTDLVVIFGILHHIPEWRRALAECWRVLRPNGEVYLEEPDGSVLAWFEATFHWGHPDQGWFLLRELQAELERQGFQILAQARAFGFGFYRARRLNAGARAQ